MSTSRLREQQDNEAEINQCLVLWYEQHLSVGSLQGVWYRESQKIKNWNLGFLRRLHL